jgi:hypothetical protein
MQGTTTTTARAGLRDVARAAARILGASLVVSIASWAGSLSRDARRIWIAGHDRADALFPANRAYVPSATADDADPDAKNAFRHCFGACLASSRHGVLVTTIGGRLRETANDWRQAIDPSPDTRADLCNNAVGARWGADATSSIALADARCEVRCATAARATLAAPDDASSADRLCRRP